MPPANKTAKELLSSKFDWNTPGLKFKGCLKYVGPAEVAPSNPGSPSSENQEETVEVTEDLLEDAVQETVDEEEEAEIDLTPADGWAAGEVYIDSRLNGSENGYANENAKLNMPNYRDASPLDYFLHFLPLDHFKAIINNTNVHGRNALGGSWVDITFPEYMKWLSLLTIMTVVHHCDRDAYWKKGKGFIYLTIDFSDYMSQNRFNAIMRMHVFEEPSRAKQIDDSLYQIHASIQVFNDHMPSCLTPGKYLVIDESMNQWLGIGMSNLKVPRKPDPIGQEFKTLADHHTFCVLRIDTVSDPKAKEYDDEGMRQLTATVKRLVKPWFAMLTELGLYSIMQVAKRRYWPRGMPATDIVEHTDSETGSYFIMRNQQRGMFVCAFRHLKVKAFISSCETTRLTSSVDAANNLRDNMISCHDVISTERWEMRFISFLLGICEANAFAAYRVFSNDETDAQDVERVIRTSRSNARHTLVSAYDPESKKRKRRLCSSCKEAGRVTKDSKKFEEACTCDTSTILCDEYFLKHYTDFSNAQSYLNNFLQPCE
ncbi:hypothetical protein [Parasitella parasitica]|uniref:PiggyBac transposable element-derived protein domain-containing protein n=1 Tax=Parasitella parasitica TaxID=35722 RepID=A0A0B7N210_9FUNG|nr:hypothetical protein [Parasitella parasitica]